MVQEITVFVCLLNEVLNLKRNLTMVEFRTVFNRFKPDLNPYAYLPENNNILILKTLTNHVNKIS